MTSTLDALIQRFQAEVSNKQFAPGIEHALMDHLLTLGLAHDAAADFIHALALPKRSGRAQRVRWHINTGDGGRDSEPFIFYDTCRLLWMGEVIFFRNASLDGRFKTLEETNMTLVGRLPSHTELALRRISVSVVGDEKDEETLRAKGWLSVLVSQKEVVRCPLQQARSVFGVAAHCIITDRDDIRARVRFEPFIATQDLEGPLCRINLHGWLTRHYGS